MQKAVKKNKIKKNGDKVKAKSSSFKKRKERNNLGKTGHLPKLKGTVTKYEFIHF